MKDNRPQAASSTQDPTPQVAGGTTVADPTEGGTRTQDVLRGAAEMLVASLRQQLRDGDIASGEEAEQLERQALADIESRILAIEQQGRRGFVAGSGESPAASPDGFNWGRVAHSLAARANNDPHYRDYAPAEWEMSDLGWEETRAQATAPDTAGGFLVPGQVFLDQIIPILRPLLIVEALGAIDLPATTTPVEIPKEGSLPAVDAVAENVANTDTDVSFGMLRMEPHTAQSFIKASRRFLTMGAGADQFIRSRMIQELAIELNRWALLGTGAGNEPLGILNVAGINTASFTGLVNQAAVYEKLLEMEDALADDNALDGAASLGWASSNRAIRALRSLHSEGIEPADDANLPAATTTFPILEVNRKIFSDGAETNILGYPYRRTTQLRNSNPADLILGDWSKMIMARWGTVVLEASNQAGDSSGSAFTQRQTWLVAYMDADIGVTQPTAFCAATAWDLSSL